MNTEEKSVKPFKLHFNNEIHRISKVPSDYNALLQAVRLAFKASLPPNWALQYEDSDGDKIMLSSDDDYKAMLECEGESASKSIKIYLVALEETSFLKSEMALGHIPMADSVVDYVPKKSREEPNLPVEPPKDIKEFQDVQMEESVDYFAPPKEKEEPNVPKDVKEIQEAQMEESVDYYPPPKEKEEPILPKEEPKDVKEAQEIQMEESVDYYAPPREREEPKAVEEPVNVVNEPVIEKKELKEEEVPAEDVQEKKVEEEEQKGEAVQPIVEEEDQDKVNDLEEKNETSSAQMDDAVDTHDDDRVESREKPEKKKRGCKKREVGGEAGWKDENKFNLRKEGKKDKKEKMRGLVTDILFENVPVLAEIIQEYLKDPSAFNLEEIKRKCKPQEEDKTIHEGVSCDGCGAQTIVGVRYKCSVCQDFDYCTKCESSIEHPHPFLKMKGQSSNKAAVNEERPKRRSSKKGRKASAERSAEKIKHEEEPKKQEVVEEVKVEEPVRKEEKPVEKPVEKPKVQDMIKMKPEPEVKEEIPIDIQLTKEVCTIPSKITVNDKVIYKTVTFRNTGKVQWPNNLLLKNIDGVAGQDTKLVQLAPGAEFSCILILDNPSQEGEYISTWQLSYTDDNKEIQFAGKPITVSFKVHGNGQPVKKEEEQKVDKPKQPVAEPPKKEEPKKEEPKKEESPKKVYPDKIREAARSIKEIFPDSDIDELCEFALKHKQLSNDDLLNKYMEGMM